VQNVLSQVKSATNEQRPKVSTSRTLLLHDNAGPHKARATTQSLRELGIQVLPTPPTVPTWHHVTSKAVNSELQTILEDYQIVFRK
ncbi:transposase, partial [Elysia marginata]